MTGSTTTPLARFDTGHGKPLVFVHGSASDHRTWVRQVAAFASDYRVVTYSRRYHWPNDPPGGNDRYRMDDHVDDLVALLQSLDAGPVNLVGHSYGAYLALWVAIRRPALVQRLVLAEAPVIPLFTSFPPKPTELLSLAKTHPLTALLIVRFAATGLVPASLSARRGDLDLALTRFGKVVLGRSTFHALPPARLAQARQNTQRQEFLDDDFMTTLHRSALQDIDIPTLLITGRDSPRLFHVLTDHLERLIPDTQRIDVADASHMMHEDNSGAFNTALRDFLSA